MFDLPRETHSWLIEEISEFKHAKQMIMSRYINFTNQLANNKRPCVRSLFKLVSNDTRTVTGSNIRHTIITTGTQIYPRLSSKAALKSYRVYTVPSHQHWRIGMLHSLMEIRENRWSITFDEEQDSIDKSQISLMIEDVCTS